MITRDNEPGSSGPLNSSEWERFESLVIDAGPEGTLRPSLFNHTYFDKDLGF